MSAPDLELPSLTTRELAARLNVHEQTPRRWRAEGSGPLFFRTDRGTIRYREIDVALWLEQVRPTNAYERPKIDPDPALLIDDTVTVAVQVNGKLRATISVPRDADRAAAEKVALEQEGVQRALDGKPVRKVIVVPNRIVNVVA